jgi:hypothetical protein
MSSEYPSEYLNGLEEKEEKTPRKYYRGSRRSLRELQRMVANLEQKLQREQQRASLMNRIRELKREISKLQG